MALYIHFLLASLILDPRRKNIAQSPARYLLLKFSKIRAELQKVIHLPPNLKCMVSTFLVLTQCKRTEKQLGSVVHQTKTYNYRSLIFPYHLFVLAQVLGLLSRLEDQESHGLKGFGALFVGWWGFCNSGSVKQLTCAYWRVSLYSDASTDQSRGWEKSCDWLEASHRWQLHLCASLALICMLLKDG